MWHARIAGDERFVAPLAPELDIVVWAVRAASASEASARARRVFEAAGRRGLHLALATLPIALFGADPPFAADAEGVTCLRSVLMKPEHREAIEELALLLQAAMRDTGFPAP